MSCNCPCPPQSFPPPANIAPGLTKLPRQVLGFPEYRDAMLAAIRGKIALDAWTARESGDLGVMMLEWAAYVFDVVAFYDARTTEEAYIRTARDLPSAREIAGLIGYRPRPAIAAHAELAAITDPNTSAMIPAGAQFRSEAFDDNPPQIFESSADVLADSGRNQWQLAPIAPATAQAGAPLLFDTQSVRLTKGAVAKFDMAAANLGFGEVIDVVSYRGLDDKAYARPVLSPDVALAVGTNLAGVAATCSTMSARVIQFVTDGSDNWLILDSLYQQLAVADVVLKIGDKLDLFTVKAIGVYDNIRKNDTDPQPIPVIVATKVTLEKKGVTDVPTSGTPLLLGNFVRAGALALPAMAQIDPAFISGTVPLDGLNEPLGQDLGGTFTMLDKRDTGAEVDGVLSVNDLGRGQIAVAQAPQRDTKFTAPIRLFGNTISITRGETVANEVLGSGDATAAFQTFKLQRKPLTYLPSKSAALSYASTLQIRVNDILWSEVDSFYGTQAADQVYIVRHDEDGESYVTFGDGAYGSRPSSGVNNIVATYRTGAGSAKPPMMTIRQAVTPRKGVSQYFNPVGASGGADAESPDEIRTQAALGALTLGRAVSLDDFEAMARGYPGIVNAIAGWAWDWQLQRAVVTIWFIADGGDPTSDLREYIADRSDPSLELSVQKAKAVPVDLATGLEFDPRYDRTLVEANVIATLSDAKTGLLSHARAPIGGSIFRSAVFEAMLAVPGVTAITSLTAAIGNAPAAAMPFALSAGQGSFLDFLPFTNR